MGKGDTMTPWGTWSQPSSDTLMGQGDSATTGEGAVPGASSLGGLREMGGRKDIRTNTRTLREDKATTCWGEGKDMMGLEQWRGEALCRGGPRGFQGVFRRPRVDLGSPGGFWLLSRCLCISG